jgi:hypothetical protein
MSKPKYRPAGPPPKHTMFMMRFLDSGRHREIDLEVQPDFYIVLASIVEA